VHFSRGRQDTNGGGPKVGAVGGSVVAACLHCQASSARTVLCPLCVVIVDSDGQLVGDLHHRGTMASDDGRDLGFDSRWSLISPSMPSDRIVDGVQWGDGHGPLGQVAPYDRRHSGVGVGSWLRTFWFSSSCESLTSAGFAGAIGTTARARNRPGLNKCTLAQAA